MSQKSQSQEKENTKHHIIDYNQSRVQFKKGLKSLKNRKILLNEESLKGILRKEQKIIIESNIEKSESESEESLLDLDKVEQETKKESVYKFRVNCFSTKVRN